jgi:hypothetical protein
METTGSGFSGRQRSQQQTLVSSATGQALFTLPPLGQRALEVASAQPCRHYCLDFKLLQPSITQKGSPDRPGLATRPAAPGGASGQAAPEP